MVRAGLLVVACVLVGCASGQKGEAVTWARDVQDKDFWVAAIDGTPVLAGSVITARFGADGRVSGKAQNGYSAAYTVSGEDIDIGPVASTKMFNDTPPGAMEQETRYFRALDKIETWEWEKGLILRSGDGEMLELMEGAR